MRPLLVLLAVFAMDGCAPRPAPQGVALPTTRPGELGDRTIVASVNAACFPPLDWTMDPLKQTKNHVHQVWVSPTGNTAYGVIRFSLPLPVGPETVLWFFLREMRASEGAARLISKRRDPQLNGLRFVAEGGQYDVRANLTTRGLRGWAVYAGTRRDREILPKELFLAELAREKTETGVDGNPRAAKP